jgi:hypothetical protein
MGKYLKTKPNSLESAVLEAVSPAQQAAIAIAKKEKGEKPKNEKTECPQCEGKGCDHCDGKGYHEEVSEKMNFSDKEVKMAIGIASDKRYKGGNMTGAVNAIEKIKKGLSNHPQVAAVLKRQNENKEVDEGSKEEYEKFFKAALKKFGVDSPADFKSDEEKKKFFDYIDKNYEGEGEKSEQVKESTNPYVDAAAKHISTMWKEAAKVKKEEDEPKKKEDSKTTMTGKPMSGVQVNPLGKE